jgi:predicted RNA methylase
MIRHPEVNVALTYVNDRPRLDWFKNILQNIVKDQTVFEIGSGIGPLAAYCLEFGAQHYYGVDVRSSRTMITQHVLDHIGYKNRHTVKTADFLSLASHDVPNNIDVLLCEQIGSQFTTSTTMVKIWRHANKLFQQPYISVPDSWCVNVSVYEGQIDNTLADVQPRIMYNHDSLPRGFYDAVSTTDLIKPSQIHDNIIKIGPTTADHDISFVLDLRDYNSATLVISDYASYLDSPCQGISYTTDWPPPHKIVLPKAGQRFRFTWDPTARRLPNFNNGFWTWQAC